MPFLHKKVKRKTRTKEGRDVKLTRLYRVGAALLADEDYEDVSVAQLARAAGTSVGSFYGRFAHKDNFIELLIALTFRGLSEQTEADLAPARWEGATKTKLIQGVVHCIAAQLSNDRNAGILRAAIKLGTREPVAWQEIRTYRDRTAACAVKLMESLSERSSAENVRSAIQMVFGTVIDAALFDSRPLQFATSGMVTELSETVARYLGVAGKHEWEKVTIRQRERHAADLSDNACHKN